MLAGDAVEDGVALGQGRSIRAPAGEEVVGHAPGEAPAVEQVDAPPVEPADPTSLSQYNPAPRIGESPTRPAILNARPLVVVTHERLPFRSNALQWMVPV